MFESSSNAKTKRNAQNIASTFTAARAAGASFGTTGTGVTAVRSIATALSNGINGAGAFSTTKFQLSTMSQAEQDAAAAFLSFDEVNQLLQYTGANDSAAAAGN